MHPQVRFNKNANVHFVRKFCVAMDKSMSCYESFWKDTPTGKIEMIIQRNSKRIPQVFWKDVNNQRLYLDQIMRTRQMSSLDDWYKMKVSDIVKFGGYGLINFYHSSSKDEKSLFSLLKTVYSEHNWIPWKLSPLPKDFWKDIQNQKDYLKWLAGILHIKDFSDWYKVRTVEFEQNYGAGLLLSYNYSLYTMLSTVYPHQYKWIPWLFVQVPRHWWRTMENQRIYFEWLKKELNINQPEDWYCVTIKDISAKRGSTLLHMYGACLYTALCNIYPNFTWNPLKFRKVPRRTVSPEDMAKLIHQIGEELHISRLEDWYRVSRLQLLENGGSYLLKKFGNLYNILRTVYPEFAWDVQKLGNQNPKKASQRFLKIALQKMFPDADAIEEFQISEQTQTSQVKTKYLDVYFPALSLAFEYQGRHHYEDVFCFGPQSVFQEKDFKKHLLCEINGITLITVPYWWDKKIASLVATVAATNPSLLAHVEPQFVEASSMAQPIPSFPPKTSLPSKVVMQPTEWTSSLESLGKDLTGWLMLKWPVGVRALWNGRHFVSQNGKIIEASPIFTNLLPNGIQLDGFLSVGDSPFEETLKELKNSKRNELLWTSMIYRVFDIPNLQDLPYRQRAQKLSTMDLPKSIKMVLPEATCEGVGHMKAFAKKHGNVLVVDPQSLYIPQKSDRHILIRVSPAIHPLSDQQNYDQSQVIVLQVLSRSNGLLCEQENGKQCIVNCGGLVEKPRAGSRLMVQHQGYWNSGLLKYPMLA